MVDVKSLTIDGAEYNIKDSQAREDISSLTSASTMKYNSETDYIMIKMTDGTWKNWKYAGMVFDGVLYSSGFFPDIMSAKTFSNKNLNLASSSGPNLNDQNIGFSGVGVTTNGINCERRIIFTSHLFNMETLRNQGFSKLCVSSYVNTSSASGGFNYEVAIYNNAMSSLKTQTSWLTAGGTNVIKLDLSTISNSVNFYPAVAIWRGNGHDLTYSCNIYKVWFE